MKLLVDAARSLTLALKQHRYGALMAFYVGAAALTGAACVWFMWGFEWVLARRIDFVSAGAWPWLAAPAGFAASVWLIRRFAPCAAGTGIPQTVFAAQHMTGGNEKKLEDLTSAATLLVKVGTLFLAVWVGASTGREGPTVHVATCVFMGIMLVARRLTGLEIDLRSAVVAGGAAGLAAAFNTPLAGVTFAIEELSGDYFGSIKDLVIMAIVVAAIIAKAMTGEYAYFGRLPGSADVPLRALLAVSVLAGGLGALFSTAILRGQRALKPAHERLGLLVPAAFAVALMALARASAVDVLGPGNGSAQELVRGGYGSWAWAFPFEKAAATLLTYWSGIAGGIFAPCLAIGAALGADVARSMSLPVAGCAMVGMAAFLSGTIQAPVTTFVIIFEMTGHHEMLLPVMLGALVGFMTARLLGAEHLYQALAEGYEAMLGGQAPSQVRH